MNLFDGPDLLETTSTEVKNRILKPGQMLHAIDTGALYYGDKDGKPTAFVGTTTNSDGVNASGNAGVKLLSSGSGTALPAPAAVWESAPHRRRLLIFGCSIAQQCNDTLHTATGTIPAETLAGTDQITVNNGALFTVGGKVAFALYNARIFRTTVTAIAGNVLTLADKVPGFIRAQTTINAYTSLIINRKLGAINAAVAMLGGPVEVVQPYGYGGAIYQQMYADLERDLRYYRPHYVALHMFENDMTSAAGANTATLSQLCAWARQCARMCLSYGAIPIVCSSMPYYNSVSGVGIPAGRAADFDGLLAYLCTPVKDGKSQLQVDVPGSYGMDLSTPWLDTSNPTWPRAPLAGVTDGVHPVSAKIFYPVGKAALPVTLRNVTTLSGTTGTKAGAGAANISGSVPASWTFTSAGTAIIAITRNADGSLKLYMTWPGDTNRNNDALTTQFSMTHPKAWAGSTQRFQGYLKFRVNSMKGIGQIFPQANQLPSWNTATGTTGIDMCATMPTGVIMLLTTSIFEIPVGGTTIYNGFSINPDTAVAPGAYLDIDICECGVLPVMPEPPHNYV